MDTGIIKIFLFAAVSTCIVYISRKSLFMISSHGFYRLFAWEAIAALVLVNIRSWFIDPLSTFQIISWMFLCGSLIVLGLGFFRLRTASKPSRRREDETLLEFEKTSTLVTSGIYRYIRHPLYASLLFLAWGAFLKDVSWSSIFLTTTATLCLGAAAKADEAECSRYFGLPYQEYMLRTKMFIPFFF